MSDSHTVWMILRTARSRPLDPLNLRDLRGHARVVPAVVAALHVDEKAASRLIATLFTELSRLPDGRQFFRREGDAIVPLPESLEAARAAPSPLSAYPYEL